MTQEGLGRAVELDRSAICRLEQGERKLDVPELVRIASVLGRPLAHFVTDPVPAVASRRRDGPHATTRGLDTELESFASDVRGLLERDILAPAAPVTREVRRTPRTHDEAEQAAAALRTRASLGSETIDDLARLCEEFGLHSFAAPLGAQGADGACVELAHGEGAAGAAVINGDMPAGRRRMTLAHELGHWVFADAYDAEAAGDGERMINSFAIHFLAPRPGVRRVWSERSSWQLRDRALAIGAVFRLSWSAALGQLRNLDLIDREQHRSLSEQEPRSGDYLRLGLTWREELQAPSLSPGLTAAILTAYATRRLTRARTLELLRGTLAAEQLPARTTGSLDDLRRSFADHDA